MKGYEVVLAGMNNLLHDQTSRTSHGGHCRLCLKRCFGFGCDVIGGEKGSVWFHVGGAEATPIIVILCETVQLIPISVLRDHSKMGEVGERAETLRVS